MNALPRDVVRRTALRLLPPIVAVGFAGVVFRRVVDCYFHDDDFLDLHAIANEPVLQYVLRPSAGHVYILRNAVFDLCYRLFGPHPAPWLTIVLVTHLVNVALLWTLVRRLTESRRAATFAAVLWGAAPVHEATLAWWSVYGQVLVATFLLLVLRGMAATWRRDEAPRTVAVLGWCALLVLAAISFGVGVGLALAFPVVMVLLFGGRRPTSPAMWLACAALPVVVTVGYWAAHRLYALHYGDPVDGSMRFFFALAAYGRAAAAMVVHLVAVGATTLVRGFTWSPESYPDAAGETTGALFALAVALGVATARGPQRRLMLALVVVMLATYAIIAIGRAPIYAALRGTSTYGAVQGRYQYVATIPMAVLLAVLAAQLADALRLRSQARTAACVAWLGLIVAVYAGSDWRLDTHDVARRATESMVATIDRAIRATPPSDPVVIPNRGFNVFFGQGLFAGPASLFTIWHPDGVGRPVYFVETDPRVLALRERSPRLAAVLVSPQTLASLVPASATAGVGKRR